MANNYLQFSFAVNLPTAEIQTWAKTTLDNPPTDIQPEWCESEDLEVGFDYTLDGSFLCIYAEEYGDIDCVVHFLMLYLRHPGCPVKSVGFAYAETCSKPRLDEFGGGAVFVTAHGASYMNTQSWLDEQAIAAG